MEWNDVGIWGTSEIMTAEIGNALQVKVND
jgi:hypothetical protein